jgi:enamine deaminase RidA (YjgF/YER057c/UK114 family)
MYVTDATRWEEVGRAHGEVFGEVRPVTALLEVSGLLEPWMQVEIEADAYVANG